MLGTKVSSFVSTYPKAFSYWSSGATAEHEVMGLIPGLGKVLLGLSIRFFATAVVDSGFVPS